MLILWEMFEGEKKTTRKEGGGGVELYFLKLLLLRSRKLSSGSESEWVQSLCAADNVKNRRRKNTINYTGSFHKPEVVLSSLHFQGEFHKHVISNYKLLNHTRKRLIFAQGQLQETSMLNHNWKRLLCSRTTLRDFLCSITPERDF